MAKTQSSTPPFFNFLKEGVLLPARNQRLFVAVFALVAASTSLLLLGEDLAVEPRSEKLNLDIKALNGTDPKSPEEFTHLLQEIQDDTRNLMLASAGYLAFAVIVGSVIRIIVLFAAVTTHSGELHTFGELLSKAKTQLKGPLLTLGFVFVLEIAYAALVGALAMLLGFLLFKHDDLAPLYVVVVSLVLFLALVFLIYFSFLCSLSVVVAVAEPGCHGAGAVGRAWRLMKGKRRRVVLFVAVPSALAAVASLVHKLARTCAVSNNVASEFLLEFLYAILMTAVELFALCAMTAFYYECKGSTEASATGYAKVSTQEPISA